MNGVSFHFWASVVDYKIRWLEIVSLGLAVWDGSELEWCFIGIALASPAS